MFSRTAFMANRTPPVPEAFAKGATANGKQKEENENEEAQPLPHSTFPVTSRTSTPPSPRPRFRTLIDASSSSLTGETGSRDPLDSPADAATSSRAKISFQDQPAFSRNTETEARAPQLIDRDDQNQTEKMSSIAVGKVRYQKMLQNSAVEAATDPNRTGLCRKVGEMLGEDIAEFTIFPMIDIEHSDEAMIARVKDLVLSVFLADQQPVLIGVAWSWYFRGGPCARRAIYRWAGRQYGSNGWWFALCYSRDHTTGKPLWQSQSCWHCKPQIPKTKRVSRIWGGRHRP